MPVEKENGYTWVTERHTEGIMERIGEKKKTRCNLSTNRGSTITSGGRESIEQKL